MFSHNHMFTAPRTCLAALAVLLLNTSFNSIAWAEDKPGGYSLQTHIGADGLAIRIPTITQPELLATLNQAYALLSQQRRAARQVVSDRSKGDDAVIAAVMPGGLIYYAIQKQKLNQAKITLSKVKTELNSLDVDAVSLYDPVGAIVIARHP